jgi:hypothetical protein
MLSEVTDGIAFEASQSGRLVGGRQADRHDTTAHVPFWFYVVTRPEEQHVGFGRGGAAGAEEPLGRRGAGEHLIEGAERPPVSVHIVEQYDRRLLQQHC